ncbi:transposase-like protein, partial [mine drainage metagenome]
IVYHSSKLEKKHLITFMKRFRKVYLKVRNIMASGDSDAMEKARYYLEAENLNETIILPSLKVNSRKMAERFSMMGKNALFTNINGVKAGDLIDLYAKRNRVEHCFRTISMRDLASPVYHWTPQKIKVHMLFSYLAYLFLALIHHKMKGIDESVSLISALDVLAKVRLQYLISGKKVKKKLDSKSTEALNIASEIDLISLA